MHIDNVLDWTGITTDTMDEFLTDEVVNMKVVQRSAIGDIVRYKAVNHNLIIRRYSTLPEVHWRPIGEIVVELDAIVRWRAPYTEYPTAIMRNDKTIIQVEFTDDKAYRGGKAIEFRNYAKLMLGCSEFVWMLPISEEKTNYNDVALLAPTHDGVPASWVDWAYGAYPMWKANSVFNGKQVGLTTDNIKTWFQEARATGGDDPLVRLQLGLSDVYSRFVFNKGYKRYNGSITDDKILMPVIAHILTQAIEKGVFPPSAISNWMVWNQSNGNFSMGFGSYEQLEESTNQEPEAGPVTKLDVGKWVFAYSKQCKVHGSRRVKDIMDNMAGMIHINKGHVPDVTVISASDEKCETYMFQPAEGIVAYGHVLEIAEAFRNTVIEAGFCDDDYYM